ncbi:MAG: hypothetical protein KGN37_17075, partial [Burkholderiales bacterium]|nr:hypothetical protein [Burkholderiales bacterium]
MTIAQLSFRSIAVAAALLAAGASASAAGLTIPINFTVSNSVQTFSKDAMGGFRVMEIAVEAKGNGTPVAGDPASYSFPVTQIVIGSKLNVAAGAAVGSALQITRLNDDSVQIGLTVANFTINYDTKQVLADTTIFGGNPATDTAKQMPLYNFTVAT